MSSRASLNLNLAGIAVVIVTWQLMVTTGVVSSNFIPTPWEVAQSAASLLTSSRFTSGLGSTVLAWLASVLIVTATAVPLGILIGRVSFLRKSSILMIETLRPIPSVAILPLAVLLLGLSSQMKIALAVYASFWPLIITTIYGVASVDRVLINSARLMGWSEVRILRRVIFPGALRYVITGLRVSTAIALILVLTAELLAGTGGIGHEIAISQTAGRVPDVFAGVLITGLIGVLGYTTLVLAEKRFMPWTSMNGVTS